MGNFENWVALRTDADVDQLIRRLRIIENDETPVGNKLASDREMIAEEIRGSCSRSSRGTLFAGYRANVRGD